MRLYHTTKAYNVPPILQQGLLKRKSKGKLKACWLHTEAKTSWAFLHCVRRHGGRIQDVVTIAVDVPDEWVRRSSADGLYYVPRDIPAYMLKEMQSFELVSRSPLESAT